MATRKTPAPQPAEPLSVDDIQRRLQAIEDEKAALLAKLAAAPAEPPATPAGTPARRAARPRTSARVHTRGGAAFSGSVTLANGHLIGRDWIQHILQVVQPGEDAEDMQLALSSYLHALATDLAGLRLAEFDTATNQTEHSPLQLRDIYVPLDTTLTLPKGQSLAKALAARPSSHAKADIHGMLNTPRGTARQAESVPVTALQALAACPTLTLLGAPGSGKSTFGAHVLLALAQAWQGLPGQLDHLGKGWTFGPLLPVRVVLRQFAERHAAGGARPTAGQLWQFIGESLHDGGWGDAARAMAFVQRLVRRHGALVLFDGLDECGDAARRGAVLAAVQAFMKQESARSRFLLTARPYAFAEGARPQQGIFALADFDPPKIDAFVTAWYAALARRGWRSETMSATKRDELLAAYRRDDLLPLASNPLLLTLMATLHSNRGRLPDDRAQLYDDTVELLLQRWNQDRGDDRALLDTLDIPGLTLRHLRIALEGLALRVHEANVGNAGLAEVGEFALAQAFLPLLKDPRRPQARASKDKADLVLDFIERRAGLLLGHGAPGDETERRYTFPHRTFQEFLAACALSRRTDFAATCRRLADANADHWRVVLPLAARLAGAEHATSAADELLGGVAVEQARLPLTAQHWRRALVAGQMLQEVGVAQLGLSDRSQAMLDKLRGWLVAGLPRHPDDGGAPAKLRAAAGDVLAALGDPRFDPVRFSLPADAMLGFEHVPADPDFCIGTRHADAKRHGARDNELNDEPTPTPDFWIARHPVTVAQYRAFADATRRTLDATQQRALRDPDTRPVRWVAWQDALDYAGWLQQMLATSAVLADSDAAARVRSGSWQVDLPSELEWEKAARGGTAHAFPWGMAPDAERANMQLAVGDTSAVGCYPRNGHGLHDMVGNVFEWTRSPMAPYPLRTDPSAREDTSATHRVVRGGAWLNASDYARCAFRFHIDSDYRFDDLGFRVVLRSAPVLKR